LFTQNSINSEAILNYFNEHYANKYKIVHHEKTILQKGYSGYEITRH
jgi:hypothetical protein